MKYNKAQIIYEWGDKAPSDVRTRIENIFQCVPKKAFLTGFHFLYDDEQKDLFPMNDNNVKILNHDTLQKQIQLHIKKGATGVIVKYEEQHLKQKTMKRDKLMACDADAKRMAQGFVDLNPSFKNFTEQKKELLVYDLKNMLVGFAALWDGDNPINDQYK